LEGKARRGLRAAKGGETHVTLSRPDDDDRAHFFYGKKKIERARSRARAHK